MLTLGHCKDSLGCRRDDLVVPLESVGVRERACPLTHLGLDADRRFLIASQTAIGVFVTHELNDYFTGGAVSNSTIASLMSCPTRRQSENIALASAS